MQVSAILRGVRGALPSIAVGFGIFLIGVLVDAAARHYRIGSLWEIVLGDMLAGVLAGLIVWRYEVRRQRIVMDRLRVIAEMNHHVRNALQVVSYSAATHEDAHQAKITRESVDRIEWALREVLPGKTPDQKSALHPPKPMA